LLLVTALLLVTPLLQHLSTKAAARCGQPPQ
jgi:hypothetical protein